ncbi:hypothetical protein [Candidatus Nitrososphaera gargensis]|uniref:hypothetical protein n=1 Tax=Candidatus Nitrososphaera gargensis TaxID=497727 RepID=UPI0011E54FE1|nr:hypothetical protein [Candidatus Nitrososphaera gargensis]
MPIARHSTGNNMKYPIRNLMYEKIRQAGTLTDADLMKDLSKDGVTLAESEFNKTLLDLEIYGLVRVSWVTKDKRRIELVADSGTAS